MKIKKANLHQLQKDCHQDNMLFADSLLNILADNISFHIQVKNQ